MKIFGLIIIILLFFTFLQISAQEKIKIDSTKPSIYVDFIRVGKGEPIRIEDSEERVWLKFVNNTKWSVYLSVFDIGDNENGLFYDVEKIRDDFSNQEIPRGYNRAGAGSPDSELKSGKSINFSVPQNHLADNLKIKIDYTYKWEFTEDLNNSYSIPINIIYIYSFELKKFINTKNTLPKIKEPITISHFSPNTNPIFAPQPKYPKSARMFNASGEVVVEILVDEKGNVEDAKVVSGHALLKVESLRVAKLTKFKPFSLSGIPVKARGILIYKFIP
jgi:TonB family protein